MVDRPGDSAADGGDASQAPWVAAEGGWGVADGVGGVSFPEGVGDEGGLVGFEAGAFGVSADAGHQAVMWSRTRWRARSWWVRADRMVVPRVRAMVCQGRPLMRRMMASCWRVVRCPVVCMWLMMMRRSVGACPVRVRCASWVTVAGWMRVSRVVGVGWACLARPIRSPRR